MPRKDRAKQFAPFDTLKGLHEALRLKEYEHERTVKGDLPEEKIAEISQVILDIEKDSTIWIKYFVDGYYKEESGQAKVEIHNRRLFVNSHAIDFDDIFDIKILKK